jgi:GntR family transcriptional regulator, trigonelline degradation regulator
VAEIYEVRAMLEATLVRRFTQAARDADIAELRGIYDEISRARQAEDVAGIVATTRRFTEHMMKVVGHELIGDILQKLFARIRVLAISVPGRLEQSGRELAAVMDAIERRNAELAAESLTRYVRNAGDAALAWLDSMSR